MRLQKPYAHCPRTSPKGVFPALHTGYKTVPANPQWKTVHFPADTAVTPPASLSPLTYTINSIPVIKPSTTMESAVIHLIVSPLPVKRMISFPALTRTTSVSYSRIPLQSSRTTSRFPLNSILAPSTASRRSGPPSLCRKPPDGAFFSPLRPFLPDCFPLESLTEKAPSFPIRSFPQSVSPHNRPRALSSPGSKRRSGNRTLKLCAFSGMYAAFP